MRSKKGLGRKLLLGLLVGGLGVALAGATYSLVRRSRSTLRDLQSIDELREQFNRDRGSPRLVLLLSPT